MKKLKVAISVGDVNGVGLQILLNSHAQILKNYAHIQPIYCVDSEILSAASKILQNQNLLPKISLDDFKLSQNFCKKIPKITPAIFDKKSGAYSFASFKRALDLVDSNQADAVLTLPINKSAWEKAGINYAGHTQYLRTRYGKNAIMMIGCEQMFVALFTEHIALAKVAGKIKTKAFTRFLLDFAKSVDLREPCAVLGVNPHCGDNGVMGNEDEKIFKAVRLANKMLADSENSEFKISESGAKNGAKFIGAIPPDTAFSPANRQNFRYFVAPYHDVGLAPLKALYFEQSINVSLNLPILRVSVDHGTAGDIAYRAQASKASYLSCFEYLSKNLSWQILKIENLAFHSSQISNKHR